MSPTLPSSSGTMPRAVSPPPLSASGSLTSGQWENIAEAARHHRPESVPVLPTLTTRSKTGKRRRCPATMEMSPTSSSPLPPPPPAARRRPASPTSVRRPATRSQSAPLSEVEIAAISKAAARGIEGSSSISIHDMVSSRYMIPEFIKDMGPNAMTLYFDERRRMMSTHNDKIRDAVIADTVRIREEFRGYGVITCPDCKCKVAWGNLLPHRLETCKKKRV